MIKNIPINILQVYSPIDWLKNLGLNESKIKEMFDHFD